MRVPLIVGLLLFGTVGKAGEVVLTPVNLQIDRDIARPSITNPVPYMMSTVSSVGSGPGTPDSILAFPGCEGWGCGALQQYRPNGYRKLLVTNLGTTEGSLRAAFDSVYADRNKVDKQLDFILIKASGNVFMSPGPGIENMRGFYIMGQLAPGPYVLGRWARLEYKHSEDIVIRGIALRGMVGNINGNTVNIGSGVRRLVFDHFSISHGGERMMAMANDTIRQSISGEAACSKYHSYTYNAVTIKGKLANSEAGLDPAYDFIDSSTLSSQGGWPRQETCFNYMTFAHSLFGSGQGHSNTWRHPNTNGKYVSVFQNYIYNWGQSGTQFGQMFWIDVSYNFYDAGPNTTTSLASREHYPVSIVSEYDGWLSHCYEDDYGTGCPDSMRLLFVTKNHLDLNGDWGDTAKSQDDIWRGTNGRFITTYRYDSVSPGLTYRATSTRIDHLFPLDTLPMSPETFDDILSSVGSQMRVDAEGKIYSLPDSVDREVFRTVRAGTNTNMPGSVHRDSFIINHYPDFSLDAHTPWTDTDGDDLPDAFEVLCGGDATSLEWDGDISGDGYINLEEYANGTNWGDRVLTWTDNSDNELGFEIWKQDLSGVGGDPAPPMLYDTVGPDISTYTDPNSFVGASYMVRAFTGATESDFSNSAMAGCR